MSKAKPTSFKKGQIGNPNGRPVGSYSFLRRQLMELRKLAANDVYDMYNNLREAAITDKESWAYQIYFKELVSVPKEWLNEINLTDIPKEIKGVNDINLILVSLMSKLLNVDCTSSDEVHNLIKTLNSIKLTENTAKDQTNIYEKLSAEQGRQLHFWLTEKKE